MAPALPFAGNGEGAGEVYQADSGDDGEAAPDGVEARGAIERIAWAKLSSWVEGKWNEGDNGGLEGAAP